MPHRPIPIDVLRNNSLTNPDQEMRKGILIALTWLEGKETQDFEVKRAIQELKNALSGIRAVSQITHL